MSHIGQCVGTDQQIKLRFGQLLAHPLERFNRVADPAPLYFPGTDTKRRVSGRSQPEHLDTMFRIGQRVLLFMRRHGGGHEPHLV
ncbi:MAG: hypothetical protein KatS3mg109_0514 [Pirellulaceae bacterium]|nr:MAG: hypothetical protein KatS3mg109_0514 [Pirellulaceae bacterium]